MAQVLGFLPPSHVGDLAGVPDSFLWLSTALAVVGIWGIKQSMEGLSPRSCLISPCLSYLLSSLSLLMSPSSTFSATLPFR